MEALTSGLLLEFNCDTLEAVRKEINLDKPGRFDEAIDILEDWIKKQDHLLKKDFSRDYLERTIVATKGLVERAKTRIDKLCTFRTLMPKFFIFTDVEKIYEDFKRFIVNAHLPKMTEDNYRVHFSKLLAAEGDSSNIFNFYKYALMLSEYMRNNDYSNGYVMVLDYTDANIMNFVSMLNVVEFRQALIIVMEGYGMRLKAIHFITPSKMIDALVSIFKSVLSEKLCKRIHVHKSVETLYNHVSRDILPIEYGGKERPLKTLNEEWFKVIASKQNQEYLNEMNQAKTDESFRKAEKFNESYTGMPGSFRVLSVD